jgi:isocitrate dehydrogenase (NAD+)
MLRHLKETEAAERIQAALEKTYKEKLHITRDVGGTASTSEFTEAVVQNLEVSTSHHEVSEAIG